MLNYYLLRNDLEVVSEKLVRKEFILDVDLLYKKEKKRKIVQVNNEKIQKKIKYQSKMIGIYKYYGKNIKILCIKVKKLEKKIYKNKKILEKIKKNIINYMFSIPNIPNDYVPNGKNNQEIIKWGEPRTYNFLIKDHIMIGKMIHGIDFVAGSKITGSRFVVMKGQIARMHRALSQFMLDLHIQKHGYIEIYVPYLVNKKTLYGTGQLPKFGEDLFHIHILKENKCNKYTLIPTAEVPLINIVREKILEEKILPLKMTAHTPCFRSEAGSYGYENRGLIRMHQFDKVEIVQIVRPENSMEALEEITKHAEKVLQLLQLPYRKVLLCSSEMGFSSTKTYDLEVWLPVQNIYKEISSCSNVCDFQARRMQTRYCNKNNKKRYLVHTLNGSGLAIGRTLVAIIENFQNADGSIKVPTVLRSYMGDIEYIL